MPELGTLFPVPTLLLADLDRGTWATNWTNDRTFGVELRNVGPVDVMDDSRPRHAQIAGRWYERYTQEQIVCAINLGRMVKGIAAESFDADWVIGHSMVNAVKSDPGPDFPLHAVRQAIVDDRNPANLRWLIGYPKMAESAVSIASARPLEVDRDDTPYFGPVSVSVSHEDGFGVRDMWVAQCLYRMGFNSGPEMLDLERLKRFVSWFQISTQKWKTGSLRATGAITGQLIAALKRRMDQLNLTIPPTDG